MLRAEKASGPVVLFTWNRQTFLWVWALSIWCGISTMLLGIGSQGNYFLPALASNVLAAVTMLIPLALWNMHLASLQKGHKPLLWQAMVTGSVMGLLKGMVTHISFELLTTQQLSPAIVIQNVIAPVVIGMWLVPLFGVVEDSLTKYSLERELLISERVHDGLMSSTKQIHNTELSDFVSQANTRIDKAVSPQELTQILQEIAEFDVRSISHSLWKQQEKTLSGFSLRSLAKQTIIEHRFPALIISSALFLSLFSFQFQYVSGWDAFIRTLVQTCIAYLGFLCGSRIPLQGRVSGPVIFFSIPVFVAGAITAVSIVVFGPTSSVNNAVVMTALSLSLVASALIFGAIHTARQTHSQIRAELDRHHGDGIDREVNESIALIGARETAELLHGYVHNQLVIQALRLQQSPDNKSMILQQIKDLLAQLEQGNLSTAVRENKMLPQLLNEIHELWDGIVDVQYTYTPEKAGHSESESVLLETLLHELVTNAYRHGQATRIYLTIFIHSERFEITATDNGVGVTGNKQGLGTKIFNAATANSWSIDSQPEATIVQCNITRLKQ